MEEAGEETLGTWTCVTCSSFITLGSIVQCGGLETSHFYRGQTGLGLWREGAISQVGLRDGDAANFTLPSGLDLVILAPLQKGWVSPEVKPACCLWLSLAGVSCLASLLPGLNTLQGLTALAQLLHQAFGLFGKGEEKARGENPLSNFLIPGEEKKKAI